MSNLPGVAYELCRDTVSLVDLAKASLQITSEFRTVKATYIEYSNASGDAHRQFELPLRENSGRVAFDCGSLAEYDALMDDLSMVRRVSDSFCEDEGGLASPTVVHAASFDGERRHVIHVLLFARYLPPLESADSIRRVVQSVCIREDAKGSRYGQSIEDLGEPYKFPRFGRAEELGAHDPVGGFLLFNSIFEQKLESLGFVNPDFVERAWAKMLREGSAHLPWQRRRDGTPLMGLGLDVGTVTVSLDFRKSTYMMRQAQNRSRYAHWLEALAEIARDFTLKHGGIYDKFTGDGAISHFVYDSDDVGDYLNPDQAICAAFNCAQDLVIASSTHLNNIESELDFRSGKSGPAVGLAHGPAAWSLDRDGRPVVVGVGVVNACRLCGGESGSIRTTISVKSVLERNFEGLEIEHHHMEDNKDLPKVDDPICGQLFVNTDLVSISANEIRSRATAIWEEVKARHRG